MPERRETFSMYCTRLWSKIRLLAGPVPVWLLLMTAIAIGSGAAVGVAMTDEIESMVPVTVRRALLVNTPTFDPPAASTSASTTGLTASQARFSSVSDNRTKFSAAAEVFAGNSYTIRIPITNLSNGDLVGELRLIPPMTASLVVLRNASSTIVETFATSTAITMTATGFGVINDVVQVATDDVIEKEVVSLVNGSAATTTKVFLTPLVWKFTVDAGASSTTTDDGLDLSLEVGSGVDPDFYDFEGTIRSVSH